MRANLLGKVPGWFQEWEQTLSRFLPDSELTQLNFHPEKPVSVSDTLWEVLCAALDMEEKSGGLVSPALLNALVACGYDRSSNPWGRTIKMPGWNPICKQPYHQRYFNGPRYKNRFPALWFTT